MILRLIISRQNSDDSKYRSENKDIQNSSTRKFVLHLYQLIVLVEGIAEHMNIFDILLWLNSLILFTFNI